MKNVTQLEHRDNVPWYDAPTPRLLHRCSPQTAGYLTDGTLIERCACGAMRRDGRVWIGRNETKLARWKRRLGR